MCLAQGHNTVILPVSSPWISSIADLKILEVQASHKISQVKSWVHKTIESLMIPCYSVDGVINVSQQYSLLNHKFFLTLVMLNSFMKYTHLQIFLSC